MKNREYNIGMILMGIIAILLAFGIATPDENKAIGILIVVIFVPLTIIAVRVMTTESDER